MHHVALDRARPHDCNLDDEIVEFFRLEPRQHGRLRAALDLEHAERIGALQHAVDRGVFFFGIVDRAKNSGPSFCSGRRERNERP